MLRVSVIVLIVFVIYVGPLLLVKEKNSSYKDKVNYTTSIMPEGILQKKRDQGI